MSEEGKSIADSSLSSVDSEPMVPQSKINEIIGSVKRETARKVRSEIEQELRQELLSKSGDNHMNSSVPNLTSLPDIKALVNDAIKSELTSLVGEMDQKRAQDEAKQTIESFAHKMGEAPFSEEVQSILSDPDYNRTQLMQVIPVLNEIENAREVFEHLMHHPAQMTVLASTSANQSKRAAITEAKRLSKLLAQNKEKVSSGTAKEPIQKIDNFNAASSSNSLSSYSNMSVLELQKYLSSGSRRNRQIRIH